MKSQIIFETEILLVRRLKMSDIKPYHEMQSNPKVMQYVIGEVQTEKEHLVELERLIDFYDKKGNDFWIYAIDRKLDHKFIGTVGFCKDDRGDDEIGYRFLEKYWGLGYGSNLCKASVMYCSSIGMPKLIGYVINLNMASAKILKKCNFEYISDGIDTLTKLPETKYQLLL